MPTTEIERSRVLQAEARALKARHSVLMAECAQALEAAMRTVVVLGRHAQKIRTKSPLSQQKLPLKVAIPFKPAPKSRWNESRHAYQVRAFPSALLLRREVEALGGLGTAWLSVIARIPAGHPIAGTAD